MIEGCRGIRECTIDGFARVNVFLGRNNAGKSTILEALTRTFCALGGPEWTEARGVAIPYLWARARNEMLPQGQFDFWSNRLIHADASQLHVALAGTVGTWEWWQGVGGSQRPTFPQQAARARIGVFLPTDVNDPGLERALWKEIFAARRDRELMKDLEDVFQMPVDSLQMMPDGALLVGLPKYGVPIDGHGLGVRAVFRMMLLGIASQDGILVVEEPDAHLHPEAIEALARGLTRQAKERDIQLFLTTHSVECVRAFADAAEATPQDPQQIHDWPFAAWYLIKGDDGTVAARKLSKETVLGLDDSGTDVRFLDRFQ